MKIYQDTLRVATKGAKSLQRLTDEVQRIVEASAIACGLCTVFIRHTSASLLIQEGDAAPDIERFFGELVPEVPESHAWLLPGEGADDMPAHIRAALTHTTVQIPVVDGQLHLSRLQDLYLWEQREAPHTRELHVTVMGAGRT